MKIAIIVFFMLVVSSHQKLQTFSELAVIWTNSAAPHRDECQNKTGADSAKIDRILPHGEYVDDDKLKCYMKCIGEGMQAVKNGSTINENFLEAINVANPEVLANPQLMNACFSIELDGSCEYVYEFGKCVYYTLKDAYSKIDAI